MGDPYKSSHVIQVTDTTDDDATVKITGAIANALARNGIRDAQVNIVGRPDPQSIGAFALGQVDNPERADNLFIGLNCADPDKDEGTKDNARNDFFYCSLDEHTHLGGTTNGMEFSYLKPRIQEFFRLTTTNQLKSQFRSLQVLQKKLIPFASPAQRDAMLKSGELEAVKDLDALVPSVPDITHVIEVDNFKNVKLWMSNNDRALLERSEHVIFSFGHDTIEHMPNQNDFSGMFNALVSDKLFDAGLGKTLMARNSSSVIAGTTAVPFIATLRKKPAKTDPGYTPVPQVGFPVQLDFSR